MWQPSSWPFSLCMMIIAARAGKFVPHTFAFHRESIGVASSSSSHGSIGSELSSLAKVVLQFCTCAAGRAEPGSMRMALAQTSLLFKLVAGDEALLTIQKWVKHHYQLSCHEQ